MAFTLFRDAREFVRDDELGSPLHGKRRRKTSFHQKSSTTAESVAGTARETYLLFVLSFRLLSFLGFASKWAFMFLRLTAYSLCLLPAWAYAGYQYFGNRRVIRNVCYGPNARNFLDVYLPTDLCDLYHRAIGGDASAADNLSSQSRPVVIFLTGGAWMIGYKAYGVLMALGLTSMNGGSVCSAQLPIVVSVDYRNFPQAESIAVIHQDVETALSFIHSEIRDFGGDPNCCFLSGQSAGAHLSALSLCLRLTRSQQLPAKSLPLSAIRGCLLASGLYDLRVAHNELSNRGLQPKLLCRLFDEPGGLDQLSPIQVLNDFTQFKPDEQHHEEKSGVSAPHVHLVHGLSDATVHWTESQRFADALEKVFRNRSLVSSPLTFFFSFSRGPRSSMSMCRSNITKMARTPIRSSKPRCLEVILSSLRCDS